jgi:hypothetical protein
MRSVIKISLVLCLVFNTSSIFTKQASAQQSNISFQVFYDQLSPYGEWVNYPQWGFVWIPDAGPDFVPYSTEGHWILTDDGWTWISDYSWGWAPFHYGRWDYDQYYGWFWVPGNEWGPAWVTWRTAAGYYGWAPMAPGISISATFGRAYDIHNDHWIFVRDRDIDRTDINHYYISQTDQYRVVRHSSVMNNTYFDSNRHTTYVTGPARSEIQKATGRKFNPVAIGEYNKPGQVLTNNHFQIYRPEVVKNSNREKQPAPSRITNLKDMTQASERKMTNQSGNSNPNQYSKDVRHTNTSVTQKKLNDSKPIQSQNSNPQRDISTVRQPVNVKSQHINTNQNLKMDQQPNNAKTEKIYPPQNIKRESHPNNIKTQDANHSNVRNELQPNNAKAVNTNKAQKTGRRQNLSKTIQNNKKDPQKKSNSEKGIK